MLTTATVTIADLREVVSVAVERHPDQRARIEKGAAILLLHSFEPDPTYADTWRVESATEPGRSYAVDHGVGVCECPDHRRRGGACKHLWAVRLLGALARLLAPAPVVVAA